MRINTQTGLPEETQIPWLEILEALVRRRRIIVASLLAGMLLAAFVAWLQAPLYRANAKIQLASQALSGPRVEAMTDRQILAELAMLKSPGLLRTMFSKESDKSGFADPRTGALDRVRTFAKTPARWLNGTSGVAPIDRLIREHAARIDIDRIANTNVVEVAFTDEDPEKAARFVNDLLVHHIERIASLGEGTGARTFYEQQADLLLEKWREADDVLLAFRRQHGANVPQREIHQIISTLESQQITTETQSLELKATIDFLSEQIQGVPKTVAGELLEKRDESIGMLTSRLLELKIKRIELLSTYTTDSKLVRDLDRQINDLQSLLTSNEGQIIAETMTEPNPSHQALEVQLLQTEARLNAAEARMKALDTQIAAYRQKLGRIEGIVAELSRLESAVESAEADHKTYLKQTERARLESALDASGSVNVMVIERAEVPLSPLPSTRQWILLWGTLIALLGGIGSALVVDLLNPTVKSGRQVARLTGLPVIAEMSIEEN